MNRRDDQVRTGGHPSDPVLHDFLDAELDAAAVDRVTAHLEECARCRRMVGDLERLRQQARALPPEVPPRRDLWPDIAARIEAGRLTAGTGGTGGTGRPHVAPSPGPREERVGRPQLRRWPSLTGPRWGMAAAAALAALAAGTLLLTGGPDAPGAGPTAGTGESTVTFASEIREVEESYRPAIEELRVLVDARELSPETREVLEANLAVIERAIEESREAVRSDPQGHLALTNLRRMYDAKVEALRTVAMRY
jgi:hypothetical protein